MSENKEVFCLEGKEAEEAINHLLFLKKELFSISLDVSEMMGEIAQIKEDLYFNPKYTKQIDECLNEIKDYF